MSKSTNLFFSLFTTGFLLLCFAAQAYGKSVPLDSIRVENQQGKQVIIHAVEAKETYYSLGRKYHVSPKKIMRFNNNQALRINDLIRIPTDQPFQVTPNKQAPPIRRPGPQPDNVIQYKVGKGETLYSVSKRFNVSEERLMEYNKLSGKSLQADQVLLIPKDPKPETRQPVAPDTSAVEEMPEEAPEPYIAQNRYGLRQMNERGIGVWLEGLNADGGKMLALHKTAPVGTVIKITNPMTGRSTFAKIVGKYTDSNLTRDAIVVISKAAASQIGILDKRFLVQISYGVPVP